jgi:outer membrane protein
MVRRASGRHGRLVRLTMAAVVAWPSATRADGHLTITEAIEFALAHHPSLKARAAIEAAAAARTEGARASELPDVAVVGQVNRATGNVVPGSLFAMRGLPGVSGPPRGRTFDGGVWGTSVGATMSWDLLGLARRMQEVDAALAEVGRERAGTDARRLDVAFEAADRFLEAIVRDETVQAARASVQRAGVFVGMVKALVDQSLRPGVDLTRGQAEQALAETQLARAEQARSVALAQLAEALGAPTVPVEPVPGSLLSLPPAGAPLAPAPSDPRRREVDAARRAATERKHAVQLQYLPRLELVGALWARGSGLPNNGTASPAEGLSPDTPNWGAGLVVTWPALETIGVRAQARAAAAGIDLAAAREQEVAQAIAGQIEISRAFVEGSRKVAVHTPAAVEAARAAERQATARYQAGLAPAVDVADAQRLLAQAEVENRVARVEVWRALLLLARSTGDLAPFIGQAGGHLKE